MIYKGSLPALNFVTQLLNFLDFLEVSCIFHFEDVRLESLLYLIVCDALSSNTAGAFPLEVISFCLPYSLCTAK